MGGFLLLLVAVSFGLSVSLTMVMRRASRMLGLVDLPGERKVHTEPTPSGGGVAIFAGVWVPVAVAVALCLRFHSAGAAVPVWPELAEYAGGVASLAGRLGVIFLGALLIWAIGLADDRWNLPVCTPPAHCCRGSHMHRTSYVSPPPV